jgi:DNA-binding CsgD family transcriptional regulator
MPVHRSDTKPPLVLSVAPFRHTAPGYPSPLAALVFLVDPATATRSRAASLCAVYRLTPTEARIADLLAGGSDLREVSAQLRIAFETARFHVKRILAKTGTRRQSDLIRLVLAIPALD